MNQLERFNEIIAAYLRHGWRLERVLMRQPTRAQYEAMPAAGNFFQDAMVSESTVDALWFARVAAQGGREAWELRHVADTPYALFETFEVNEAEEDREDVRREMEARLAEHAVNRSDPS